MRFSAEFGVERSAVDDWFDCELTTDTPLYVDPFLVFEDHDSYWSDSRKSVIEFFDLALAFVRMADGDETSPHWLKALRMLRFPEPSEFALGLSMGHPKGSGAGFKYARKMTEALDLLSSRGINQVEHIQTFSLFCEGLGVDRISDIFCDITKSKFIDYTRQVAERHAIPTEEVPVRSLSWGKSTGRWDMGRVSLPKSPVTGEGVLLVPRRFLKDIPVVTPESFWTWADTMAGPDLRSELNYELNIELSKSERKEAGYKAAWRRPDLVVDYLAEAAATNDAPYDTEADPKLLVDWAEAGRNAAALQQPIPSLTNEDAFAEWVTVLAEEFQHAVEQTDLWRALWNDSLSKPRPEKIVQAIAGMLFAAHCKFADVDITRESNLGRGPVDFKFSQGWRKRALLEVKLIPSTHFFSGASKQLPQYMTTERASIGVYLCVGYTDADFAPDRLRPIEDTMRSLRQQSGWHLEVIYVDARPGTKKSASTL
ncbi:hypothetical protein [Lacisediminihabitans profunda]|uniref:Uncharacterized protein n=1 Tax=Lacisediminihabitans profunda TaxID=2594790 RepID=A0A5C8UPE3_9MICO|nr:hypothetical protein [Lacisediminihabitans profunda]TXN29764.1 hypothetical protein FVP33_11480 [Lacisediminihabitans profunda]